MKTLIIAGLAAAALAASTGVTLAQRSDVVPMGFNAAGQPVCPSNYVVQGNACVSVNAGHQGGPDAVPIGRNAAGGSPQFTRQSPDLRGQAYAA